MKRAKPTKCTIAVIDHLHGIAALGVAKFHVRLSLWIGCGNIALRKCYGLLNQILAQLSVPSPFMRSIRDALFCDRWLLCVHQPQAGTDPLAFGPYLRRRIIRIYPPDLGAVMVNAVIGWVTA